LRAAQGVRIPPSTPSSRGAADSAAPSEGAGPGFDSRREYARPCDRPGWALPLQKGWNLRFESGLGLHVTPSAVPSWAGRRPLGPHTAELPGSTPGPTTTPERPAPRCAGRSAVRTRAVTQVHRRQLQNPQRPVRSTRRGAPGRPAACSASPGVGATQPQSMRSTDPTNTPVKPIRRALWPRYRKT
jgi:hypothetical protein